MKKINHPKVDLVIGKAELGASGKNMLPNLTLIRHTVYDWLDEIFLQTTEEGNNINTKQLAKELNN
jgi:hypothetical protein